MTTQLVAGAPDDLVDAVAGGAHLGVSAATVRKWASRYPADVHIYGDWVGGGRGRARRRRLYSLAELYEIDRRLRGDAAHCHR